MVNLTQWIRDILSGDKSDLYITIESILPLCDKPYHMNNGFQQIWAEIDYELFMSVLQVGAYRSCAGYSSWPGWGGSHGRRPRPSHLLCCLVWKQGKYRILLQVTIPEFNKNPILNSKPYFLYLFVIGFVQAFFNHLNLYIFKCPTQMAEGHPPR